MGHPLRQLISFQASPHRVYQALTDAAVFSEVTGASAEIDPQAGGAFSCFDGKIVGRDTELARLEKFIEPLWKQDFAGVMLLLGDAGIGKGRLVHAFRASPLFQERKVLWAVCQSEQILRSSRGDELIEGLRRREPKGSATSRGKQSDPQ